jgi:hypothetical protein
MRQFTGLARVNNLAGSHALHITRVPHGACTVRLGPGEVLLGLPVRFRWETQ